MAPLLSNTAGELEREARSRRWNALEALGLACLAFFSAWPVAYGWGILGGHPRVRDLAVVPLYLIMLFAFFVSPFLHRDTPESWGLGHPRRLWQLLRTASPARRAWLWMLMTTIWAGLMWLALAHWPRLARMLQLPPAARLWPATLPGMMAVLAIGAAFAAFIVTCVIRYDNIGPAFRVAMKVSAALVAFALAAALAHRGWAIFAQFNPAKYALDVVGYFFWGLFQQLFFCAWFGTRLRKAFGPSDDPANAAPAGKRLSLVLLAGLAAALAIAPAIWLTVRGLHGAAAAPWTWLGGFAVFAFPVGAVWGWYYGRDRKRLLVATLSGAFFGFIHMDSYGLVLVTWMLGTILSWVFMEDRCRNLAALGLIHGFLGTTFGMWFSAPVAGALHVSYRVGPWNIREPTAPVLVIPLLCLAVFLALTVWCARQLKTTS